MSCIPIELLGFVAGLTNLASSVPQLVANLKNPINASKQSPSRNACQCAGNTLWLVYGISVGSLAMTVFSSLGSVMAALLLWQVLHACAARSIRTD